MVSGARTGGTDGEGRAAAVVAALTGGVLGPDHSPEVPGRVLATFDRLPPRRGRDPPPRALPRLHRPAPAPPPGPRRPPPPPPPATGQHGGAGGAPGCRCSGACSGR